MMRKGAISYIATEANFGRVYESNERVATDRSRLDRLNVPDVWVVIDEELIEFFDPNMFHAAVIVIA